MTEPSNPAIVAKSGLMWNQSGLLWNRSSLISQVVRHGSRAGVMSAISPGTGYQSVSACWRCQCGEQLRRRRRFRADASAVDRQREAQLDRERIRDFDEERADHRHEQGSSTARRGPRHGLHVRGRGERRTEPEAAVAGGEYGGVPLCPSSSVRG